jgi:hypothetical protein
MLHYLLGAVYNSNQTQNSVYIKPNYPLLKSFFENGANPNYTLEVRKYKWANNYTSTFINAFDVIQNSDHPDEEKEKLTLLAQECVRSPINTKDPFYPDSRGYRADFAEYLKPD